MLNLLYKYLITHKTVGIPGVGNFTLEYIPAKLKADELQPPVQQISFVAGTALTDKNFYHFLANEKNISEIDAVRQFQDIAYQLKKNVQQNASLELSGVGVLRRNQLGEIEFTPQQHFTFYPSIKLQEVVPATTTIEEPNREESVSVQQEEAEEEITRDRWWIWATVLALLALAAIGYFYSQENF